MWFRKNIILPLLTVLVGAVGEAAYGIIQLFHDPPSVAPPAFRDAPSVAPPAFRDAEEQPFGNLGKKKIII